MTLPDDDCTIVIRGGVGRDPQTILDGLRRLQSSQLPLRISVFALAHDPTTAVEDTLAELCRQSRAPWNRVQVSTGQRLREAGFELLDERDEDEADCHFAIGFTETVSLLDLQRLVECFDEPTPNPVPKAERR